MTYDNLKILIDVVHPVYIVFCFLILAAGVAKYCVKPYYAQKKVSKK